MTLNDLFIVISGTIATLGFAVIFSTKSNRLIWVVLGGLLSSLCYVLTDTLGVFVCNTISAFVIMIYAEAFSRILKSPSVIFVTPGIVPLVPGGLLYYTTFSIIEKNYDLANRYALDTLDTCLGIAAGILAASLLVNCILSIRKYIISKRKRNA